LRILVTTDQWFPDLKGGLARVAADTARELAGRGHEVEVIAPRFGGLPAEAREGALTVRRVLARGTLPKTLTDVVGTYRTSRRLRASRFDVVLAHVSTTAAGTLAARVPAPLVYVYHASAVRELRDLRRRLPSRRSWAATYGLEPPLLLWEQLGMRRARRILVLSDFSRSLVEADYPGLVSRVRLVPGAVDTEWFSPAGGPEPARARLGLTPAAPLLVSVRRLEPRMGLENLVRAVALLGDATPVELSLVGGGTLAGPLRDLAAELGVEGRVRLVGRVSDDELRDWYRAADLFVLPTVAYEGFGMVTAEALASGTPVVGTPIGATPELLAPLDRRLVSAGTEPARLAEAIRAGLALASPPFRARCREYAEARFGWDTAIVEWEQALTEVVERPAR
jgi:glycosyltransferase involved in cell wall biosynthesis